MSTIHRENLILLFSHSKKHSAQSIDKKHIKRNKLLLGIFTVLLPLILILIGLYIMLIFIRNYETNLKEIPGLKKCKLLRTQHPNFVHKHGTAARNIYFIIDDSLMTAKEACAVEAVLHKFSYRVVFILQLQCNRSSVSQLKFDYRTVVANYPNAIFIKLEPKEYLSNSPVKDMWDCKNDKTQLAAMAYTAWRFGGNILTKKILINDKSLLSHRNLKVLITPETFISPYSCHGFFYKLMNNLAQNNSNFNINELIDNTILVYNNNYSNPVRNIKQQICSNYECPLIWLTEDNKRKANISTCQLSHMCPEVIKQYHINTATSDLNKTYFENI